jgi:hypothetical protein
MSRLARVLVLVSCFLIAANAFATTYYVDYSSGNDSNNGTSKTSPWQHASGMQTCTNVCSSTTINPGDSIILRGGVTWPNASFNWSVPGGSSGSPVYTGVDKTWFVGGSWTRPILTGGGAVIANSSNVMIYVPNYATFDNFEIAGFYWNTASCTGYPNCTMINMGQNTGQTLSNLYIHGWTHAGTNSSSNNGVANGILTGAGGGTSLAHDIVIVGTDVANDHSLTAFYGGPPAVYNVYCKQVASCFVTGSQVSVHDNHIDDVGPAYCNTPQITGCTHENGYEDNGDTGLNFYNNVITNVNAGLAVWLAPNPSYTVNVWNNVLYGNGVGGDANVIGVAPPVYNPSTCPQGATGNNYCLATGNFVFENNTIECGSDSTLYDSCQNNVGVVGSGSVANSVVYHNNHFISATSAHGCATGSGKATTCTFAADNVVQTLSTANGQGYNSSQNYAFSPTSSNDATVGAGTNLTSSCSGGLASLCSDTTYACTNGGGNQPSCPARTANSRAPSGAWDSGAYEFGSGDPPSPPTGLAAVVE